MIDPLSPAARLRRTLRMIAGVRLGPHAQGNPNTGVASPLMGSFGSEELLPGSAQAGPATPEAVRLSHSLRDLAIQRQLATDPVKRGAIDNELQQTAGSLAQLLRPRRRGGKVGVTAAGGKPAASIGGRPYVP
jgi:hypothetical protein